jgi:hypothetical protein
MSIIDALEGAMRGVMQGAIQRAFPSRLQEQEILDALRKVMDDSVSQEQGRQIAPSHYLVRINQRDYQGLADHPPSVEDLKRLRQRLGLSERLVKLDQLATLETRVQFEMKSIASSQGYLLPNALRVTFQPDPMLPRGRIEVSVVPEGAAVQQPAGSVSPDMTHTLMAPPIAQPAQPAPAPRSVPAGSMPPAWLTLLKPSRGEPFRLDRPTITIGRSDTNDIVINEKRVSRAHAEIRYDHSAFTLHDLASQNGVFLNGARITRPAPLKDRDIIIICGYEFIFQRR